MFCEWDKIFKLGNEDLKSFLKTIAQLTMDQEFTVLT